MEMSVEAILQAVNAHPTRFVVVTGGEPMVAKEMPWLLQRLRDAGKHITIETAGTIAPEGVACDLASISPKLAHSTPGGDPALKAWMEKHERMRLQPQVLRAWCSSYDYQLKFVIDSEADVLEVKTVIESIGIEIPPEKILLMPEGITQEALKARQSLLAELCKREGWRYSPRLHIALFGNQRGT